MTKTLTKNDSLTALADQAGTAALFLCREPMTKAGLWPIVAVSGGALTQAMVDQMVVAANA